MGKSIETPHALIFPCPAQGHVNSMLKLAELLAMQNLHITFLNTEYIHNRLISLNDDIKSLSQCYPKLQFKTISDFQNKEKHPGFGENMGELIASISMHGKPSLREILISEKISCVVLDGVFGDLATDLAEELGIQLIHFRTVSACSFWTYFSMPKLTECNELPIRGDEDMDRILKNVPGAENVLRCRDLPSFCTANKKDHVLLDRIVQRTQLSLKANAIILNTFEGLESSVLSQIRLKFPKVFTVGPLHHHLNTIKKASSSSSFNCNFFKVDRTCMTWLESQPLKSVIYVSFGSITPMKREEILEIWHGLMNSKKPFLWVIRPNMVQEKGLIKELEEGTSKERGLIVEWVPQDEVLAHKAIGAFLTHSGWNSTLESVVCGVPMICWPYFADQPVNSRFVSEVWKLGLDMKDVCDRNVVEKMVNDVLVNRKEEFSRAAIEMADLASKSVSPNGSSYNSFQDLVQYIRSISP